MAKYLSNRQKNLKIGIVSYTESNTVLEVTGKVGIGTTNAQNHSLYVVGSSNITGNTYVGGASTFVGIATFGNDLYIQNQLYVSGVNISGGASIGQDIVTRNILASGISTFTGITTSLSTIFGKQLSLSGVATAQSLNIGDTSVISSLRELQNIISLDPVTTATIEAAISIEPNTFTDLEVTGIATLNTLNIGNTSVISSLRELQNIISLDPVTTATIEAAISIEPNTFTDLEVTGISTLGVTSATNLTAQQLNVSGVSTISVNSSSDALRITQTGSGNALVVEDSTNPDATPFVVNSSGSVGIGTTNATNTLTVVGSGTSTSQLYVIGVSTLAGKIVSGNGIGNTNLANTLNYSASTGITAFRPISLVDSAAGIKISRNGGQTLGAALELQTWDVGIVTNYSYWDVNAQNGYFGIRDVKNSRSRIFIDDSGSILLGATSSNFTTNYNQLVGIGTDKLLNVLGNSHISGSVGIGTTNPTSKLSVVGDGNFTGVVTATTFIGSLTGIAASATQLVNPRTFEITGDIVASPISFDGTGNVSLAATIQPNSVGLGTDTFGDYVRDITGTANQITVTGGTGEGSSPTLSIPSQFTAPQDVTVTRDLQVNRNLSVTGNITIGGTSATLFTETLKISDSDIILGFRTDAFGNDVSNDTTANHGGIAIASTEGNPLVNLNIAGIETLPPTYKKIMWFKAGSFAGLGTDAWLFNYGVGIGSTQFPTGTRLAAGSVQFTENDLAVVRNINASGIVTAPTLSGTTVTYTTGNFITGNIVTGIVTTLSGTNLNYTGVGTITTLNSTTGNITTLNSTTGNIVTGIVTNISGTNLNYTGVGTITTLNSTTGTVANLSGTNLNYSGISTLGVTSATNLIAQQLNISGVSTFTGAVSFGTSAYFGDNDKIYFGDGNDLQIYHDGSNSFIEDAGTGNLYLQSNNAGIILQKTSGNENLARFLTDGAVELYYDNTKEFETTGYGATVFGILQSQGLQVSGVTTVGFITATNIWNAGITTSSRITLNGANDGATGGGQIYLNGATGNRIDFNTNGVNPPVFSNRSNGTKLVLYPTIGASAVDYAFGIDTNTLWYSIPTATSTAQHRWYAGITTVADLKGSGEFLLGSSTLTGTANQTLQVTGGAYVSGNLGIGTTNPGAKLDVVGRAQIGGIGISNALYVKRVTDNTVGVTFGYPSTTTTTELSLRHNAGGGYFTIHLNGTGGEQGNGFNEKFRFTDEGRIGIGRSIPSIELDVFGGGNFTNRVLIGSATSTNTASQTLQVTGGAYVSGSVGIGVTNPQDELHLGAVSNIGIRLQDTAPGGGSYATINYNDNGSGINALTLGADEGNTGTNTEIRFNIDGSEVSRYAVGGQLLVGTSVTTGIANQKLQVTGGAYVSGDVGIGTTNPTSKLSVVGDGNFTGVVTASSFSGNASSATYATNSGIATFATTAGIATYATSSGIATYATNAGIATYATNAGIATYSDNAGIATYATSSGIATYATNAGIATYATSSGIATYATNAGVSTYATSSGISSTLTSTASVNTTGIITATQLSTGSSGIGINTDTISGPAVMYIDPSPVGVGTTSGVVRIRGDLYVDGTQFVVNSSTIELADLRVGIATTVGTSLLLDGGGIGIGSANIIKTITWSDSAQALTSSEDWNLASGKQYEINNTSVLTSTTLGSGVVNSSLTSVGTLGQLNVSGVSTLSVNSSSDALRITQLGSGNALVVEDSTNPDSSPFVVNASGSVGIGTTNPTSKLQVDGNVLVSGISTFIGNGTVAGPAIFAQRDSGNNAGIKLYGTSGGNWVYSESTSSNPKSLIFDSSQSENILFRIAAGTKALIQPTGELLVGTGTSTGTASQLLQVNSGGYFNGLVGIGTTNPTSALTVQGDVLVSGIITSTDYNSTSDINLKENIQKIENPVDKVLQLNGVSFNWKESGRPSMGVIAQEVEKVIPELVNTGDVKTVNYNGLIGLLIEVVKEQQKEIDYLKSKIG